MTLPEVTVRRTTVIAGASPAVELIGADRARDWTEIEVVAGGPVYLGPEGVTDTTGFQLTPGDPRPFPTGLAWYGWVRAGDWDAVVQVAGG